MISVKINGVERLSIGLSKTADIQSLGQAVARACSFVQSAAKLKAHVNTGELREKIFTDIRIKGMEVHGEVYTKAPQGE